MFPDSPIGLVPEVILKRRTTILAPTEFRSCIRGGFPHHLKGVVMCFESAEMHRKTREAEEARERKPADGLKRRDRHSASAKKPRTWLSRVIQPALAVLLLSLAAEGQAGLSGPALVGSLSITQVPNTTNATFDFVGMCKGTGVPFSTTLNFTVSGATAASLEGLSLPGQGPAGCLSQAGGENLTVVTVVTPLFSNNGDRITAGHVVILYVVP